MSKIGATLLVGAVLGSVNIRGKDVPAWVTEYPDGSIEVIYVEPILSAEYPPKQLLSGVAIPERTDVVGGTPNPLDKDTGPDKR